MHCTLVAATNYYQNRYQNCGFNSELTQLGAFRSWFCFVLVLFFLWNLFINVTCDRYTGSYEYIECREEKCDVRLPILARVMDVNHLSWQRQPFTLSNDRRSMGYCFVPECNHAQVSHICQFFLPFFSVIFAGARFVAGYRNFATMATWRKEFLTIPRAIFRDLQP